MGGYPRLSSHTTKEYGGEAVSPLRIALVHASDFGGGAERSVTTLHKSLLESGQACTLFVGEKQTVDDGVVEIPYIRGFPGSRRLARYVEGSMGWQDIYNPGFRMLCRSLSRNFDIIHFNSLWGSAGYADLAGLPLLAGHVPMVVTMRDEWLITGHCACVHDCNRWKTGCGSCPDLNRAPRIHRDGTRFNWSRKRRLVGRAEAHIVAISDDLKRKAQMSPILRGKPIHRIYNGIDLANFNPVDPAARVKMRRSVGLGDDELVILLAGQTVEGMREGIATHHAVYALNELSRSLAVRALVIGHSAARVAEQLTCRTTTLGFVREPEHMAGCYRAADLTLVTSEVEAFGRIGAESQACGTPVVAFGAGGIPEVVVDGVGGLVVPVRDMRALIRALEVVLGNEDLRGRLGEGGAKHVREHFDQGHVAKEYLHLYQSLVREHRDKATGD